MGRNPRCDNCMAHCGYEGTAVDDAFRHPLKALAVSLRGPRVSGPMVPELPVVYGERAHAKEITIPVDAVARASRGSAP